MKWNIPHEWIPLLLFAVKIRLQTVPCCIKVDINGNLLFKGNYRGNIAVQPIKNQGFHRAGQWPLMSTFMKQGSDDSALRLTVGIRNTSAPDGKRK